MGLLKYYYSNILNMTDREALVQAFIVRKKEHDELEAKVKECTSPQYS